MPSIRIWTLESNYDAKAVKCLADKLVRHLQLDPLSVRWAGKKAFRAINKKGGSKRNGLKSAVINYLKQDDCVIIVIDNDGPSSSHQRRQEPNSLINQVSRVVRDRSLHGKIHFAPAVSGRESGCAHSCAAWHESDRSWSPGCAVWVCPACRCTTRTCSPNDRSPATKPGQLCTKQ